MRDTVEVRSAQDSSVLRFSHAERQAPTANVDYWGTELSGPVVTGNVRVYDNNSVTLASFFRELATEWRGWQGSKAWASVEQQLELRATSDRLGHTFLRVVLRDAPHAQDWRAEGTLLLEAGQLDAIAEATEEFFGRTSAA